MSTDRAGIHWRLDDEHAAVKRRLQQPQRHLSVPKDADPWLALRNRMDAVFASLAKEFTARQGNRICAEGCVTSFSIEVSVPAPGEKARNGIMDVCVVASSRS